jgi:hypothetical protein
VKREATRVIIHSLTLELDVLRKKMDGMRWEMYRVHYARYLRSFVERLILTKLT